MISICDFTLKLNFVALAFTAASLVCLWFDRQRWSIGCLAVAVVIQSIVLFEPSCASIIDLRNAPIIGGPPRNK